MARIPDIERRLLNWARWRAGPRIGSAGTGERVDGEGWDAPTVIPTLDAEAAETEAAVDSLEPTLRAAVVAVYIGGSDRKREAKRLSIAVSTLFSRVDTAHKCLERWFNDRAVAAKVERARVEALRAQQGKAPSIFQCSVAAPPQVLAGQRPRSRFADWLAELRAARGFTS